ncbi:MAG: hypothetical protein L6Q97_19375 [Thermoanaerobaculia bacterium]|nr:hypothetical protein [Thermoanaerobaculia bacterium]
MPPCLRGEIFILLLLLTSCRQTPRQTSPAFYHWKTQLALTPAETACLDTLGCRKLYVKFIDLGKDPETGGNIRPYALLELKDTAGLAGRAIVPCVFITNSVFQQISKQQIEALTLKTANALSALSRQFPGAPFSEVQFDCDWTASTREAFFYFLKEIRNHLPPGTKISATIRLHQYKFPSQTGVPPADRGMLMLYNTGDIDRWEEENSIFQPEAARKYLDGAPARYPLPLDLALPLFSWALIYRDDALWKIVPDPTPSEFADTARFKTAGGGQSIRFQIRKHTYLAGHYLRTGDLIRLERVDTDLLQEAARLTAGIDLAPDASVAFYHLDTAVVRQYPAKWLKTICERINKKR